MENVSRRTFLQGATMLAAGAAAGIPASEGLREYGPVDLRMHFFTKDHVVIKGAIFSDAKNDLFGIRVFFGKSNEQTGEVRMPLSKIRHLTSSKMPAATFKAECQYADGAVESYNLCGVIIKDDLILKEAEHDGAPLRLKMEDVERVL